MAWIWAALLPHPPVMLPEVGRGREQEATATLEGANRLCEALSQCAQHEGSHLTPDALFVLSPHQPYVPKSLFINTAQEFHGSLARFGAPEITIAARTHAPLIKELETTLKSSGIPAVYGEMGDISPDHASIVPLTLISRCFPDKKLPPLVIMNPTGLTTALALKLGSVLRDMNSGSFALLASGDLSHRLKEDGPYGFNPAGPVFDKAVVEALSEGAPEKLLSLPSNICESAGECGLRPVLTLLGLCGGPVPPLSYEGPFGVGYCTAFTPLS